MQRKEPSREEVAHLAYGLYLRRNCAHGRDAEDWLRAEKELSRPAAVEPTRTGVITQKRTLIVDVPSSGSRADFHSTMPSSAQSPSQSYIWPLAQGVSAEVRIAGGERLPEYFGALRQYLALAEKLVKPVFQEADKVEYVDAYTGETRYGTIERMYGRNAIIHSITKEEAGMNPKKFAPQHVA
jgi:hypothetical protein